MTHTRLRRCGLFVLIVSLGAIAACNKPSPSNPASSQPKPALLLHTQDLVAVAQQSFSTGPLISGSIQAERVADIRAEISAVVKAVKVREGEAIRRGQALVRLDDTAIKDAVLSAGEAVRAAELALQQSDRHLQRLKVLQASGMVTSQQMEEAELRRHAATSELSAARSRLAQAEQQLGRTTSDAPFDGVVSSLSASVGDTVQVGRELLKLMDPQSLQFEGSVSSESIGLVKPGMGVTFRVNGYPDKAFKGVVSRIHPVASSLRQVAVAVSFASDQKPALSGLYAEGQVESEAKLVLVMPPAALSREGDSYFAWCVQGDSLKKTAVTVGRRDSLGALQEVSSGLQLGQSCLRFPNAGLSDGQKIQRQDTAAPIKVKS